MRKRLSFLVDSELGDLLAALLNRVGLTLLLLSVLPYLGLLVASHDLPNLAPLAGRAIWLIPLGLIAYLATVVACLLMKPAWPADQGLQQLLDIRASMHQRLRELRAEGPKSPSAALLPEVAASLRRMDRQVVPTFGEIVVKRNRLDQQLVRFDQGELKLPDRAILEKLRRRNNLRQYELNACLQQAANAYAMLLALLNEGDGLERRADIAMWARDLEDIYDALVEVRGGLDYYDRALLGPAPSPGQSAELMARLERETGLAEGLTVATESTTQVATAVKEQGLAVEADLAEGGPPANEVKEKARSVERARARAYPDGLTGREVQVLRLLADGKTSKEIAGDLVVTIATVSRHVANIYTKIDAHGRADATRYAYAHGLIKAGGDEPPTPGGLTAFQAEVLRLMQEGKTDQQIARQLGVSLSEVARAAAAIARWISSRSSAR